MERKARRTSLGSALLVGALAVGLTVSSASIVSANSGLNGIGDTPTQQTETPVQENQTESYQSESSGNADAVGSMFESVGIDEEASSQANSYVYPIAKFANLVMAVVLSITFIAMMVITVLDLLYIAVPPVRSMLYEGGSSSGGSGGFGGGFGGGGFGGGQQQSSKSKQWISDEAKAVVSKSSGSSGGGFGGGGFGGGFGGGGFGGGQQQEESKKSVIISYAKKRVVFLVVFGVVAILLTSTIFTDIGVNVGAWLMDKLFSFNSSF